MKSRTTLGAFLLTCLSLGTFAQAPLVYSTENTGANCAAPPLPTLDQLPTIEPLPDPFMWANGKGRSTSFGDWECRRNEIKAEIEHYEIGRKPSRPQDIKASYANGVLTVIVTENGQSLTLTSQISLPSGPGPFPAIIGMNSPSGSVPASVFTSRNIARITYSHNQVTTYYNPQLTDPYYRLYPDQNLSNAGQYSAWAWGVSRIIDGLELVQAQLPIDLKHLGVTGCSYAGKMALFSGALDERIALTIAQESGGGGAPAWRVSETLGAVEKLGATDYNWFKDDMRQFAGTNVSKLPHDHHELMAMIAPRALLVTGNTDFEWLANPAAYVSARAAHEVWKQFGIGDRFGFYIDGGHNHCAVPATQLPAMEAFVDKFLLDKTDVNTNITVNPYPTLDYQRWYTWWGTGNPVLPAEPLGKRIWLEAECATVGTDWQTVADTAAANGKYVVVNGLNSTAAAPAASGTVVLPFYVDSAATYNFLARLNCPTANDDSYWIKIDNGAFSTINGLGTTGWQWVRLASSNLSVGKHTLTIGYREDGAALDKVLVTTSNATIRGKGPATDNCKTQQTISFGALPGKLFGDADFALAATASSALPVSYTSSDTTVATIINGMVHIRKAGTTTITARQNGDDTYAAAFPVSQVLTVAPLLLQVQYKDGDDSRPYGQIIKPTLRLDNLGSTAVAYSELTIRYWLTPENFSGLATNVDWAALGATHVHTRYVPLEQPHRAALGYVEYTFDASLGQLVGGANSGEIRSRFHNQAYGDLDENTDYSYRYNTPNYVPNDRITVYRNGRLVWGTEPEEITSIMALVIRSQNRNGYPRGNTISTYLDVQNVGNVPINYPALKLRYWFTPEGSTSINHWFDWAQVGTNNVGGVIGQKGDQLYFEIGFGLGLGQLYPASSTGDIRFRLAKKDWTNFNETNDHSYQAPWNYVLNDHITAYYQGELVYGAEPLAATAAPQAATLSNAATGNGPAQLRVAVLGNPIVGQQAELAISGVAGEDVQLELFDYQGRRLRTQHLTRVVEGSRQVVPLPTTAGMYLLKVVSAQQSTVVRLLKQ